MLFRSCQALPGSPLYHTAVENGWELPNSFEEFAFLSYESRPMRTKYLSAAEVLRFRDEAWQRYFESPGYLSLVEEKFGAVERRNVEQMSEIRLKRKLLGD